MSARQMITVVLCGVLLAVAATAQADGRKHRGQGMVTPPAQYESACGSCHMAYPAMLLPAASWRKLVPDSAEHFGDVLPLDAAALREARQWLEANAADRSPSRRAAKIMQSLNGAAPERITEVPYIIRKHRKVPPEVFARTAVGGLAQCARCHPGAVRGDFKDDDVRIPQ